MIVESPTFTSGPTREPTPQPPADAVVVGSATGLGPAGFGEPDTTVIPELTGIFGPPSEETSETGQAVSGYGPAPDFSNITVRVVSWDGISAVFTDVPVFRSDGVIHFVAWHAWGSTPSVMTDGDIGVGSTLAETQAAYPETSPEINQCHQQWIVVVERLQVGEIWPIVEASFDDAPPPDPGSPDPMHPPLPPGIENAVVTELMGGAGTC